jgi:L-alanine-DL-glutamate epimerase-like enolase superfamily enzyme
VTTLKLSVSVEKLPFAAPFRIAGYVFEHQDAVLVMLDDGTQRGRGEACGVFYFKEDAAGMVAAIESCRREIEHGIDRAALQSLLPIGGARNALDCALWELEARRSGRPVWELAGLGAPRPLLTTFTIGADDPAVMAEAARRYREARALKLKLTGEYELDVARVTAVRAVRPEVWLGVDANQGYGAAQLPRLITALQGCGVALIEQPLARGSEAQLHNLNSPIPLAADESVQGLDELPALLGRFQVANIKLDKCGGLTEALAMARAAQQLGLKVMVGNMMGSSLAMAPAFVLGQLCEVVDLDGPTFLAHDRVPAVTYTEGRIWCDEAVWGRESRAGGPGRPGG